MTGDGEHEDDARGRPAPGFLADAMLERLARWLRVLGYDTLSAGDLSDRELVRRAAAEGRVVLTRDRRILVDWPECRCLLLAHAEPLAQTREVLDRLGLDVPRELFRRCLICNAPLVPATAAEVWPGGAPSGRTPESLRRCPVCGRAYWEGSHTRRMRTALARALGPAAPP